MRLLFLCQMDLLLHQPLDDLLHPYKLKGIPPTPVSTLEKAWKAAMKEGLNFVYIGNIPIHPAEHTYCPHCKKMIIQRVGYWVKTLALEGGACKYCGRKISGIWRLPAP